MLPDQVRLIPLYVLFTKIGWMDTLLPLTYLHSRHNWTIAAGLQTFNALYSVNTHRIITASFVMVIPPIHHGVVVSGVMG